MPQQRKKARILLEDGTEYEGYTLGHDKSVAGEVLVYTGQPDMSRLLTDPAVRGSLILLATPLAGASGIPASETDDNGLELFQESSECQAAGLITAHISTDSYHYKAKKNLSRWMKTQQLTGIYGVDTRALVQRIQIRGTMRAKILVGDGRDVSFLMAGSHASSSYGSVKRTITYGSGQKKILLVDCGVRHSLIRQLVAPDITVQRIPCSHDFSREDFDGLFVAGGPGDPTSCEKTISFVRKGLERNKPVFATGHGAVILALAGGATPFRMAQGHRSTSIPCVNLENGRCYATAQNHGYGIRDDSLPSGWYPTFLNNNDNTLEGFATKKGLLSGVFFNPEGKPGSDDCVWLYSDFLGLVRNGGLPE